MKTIGFTNKYYTLWEVSAPYKYYFDAYNWEMRVDKCYIKNLSFNLSEAKNKLKGVKFDIDLDLKGEKGWEFSEATGINGCDLNDWQFPNGLPHVGEDIRTHNDVKALWIMYLKYKIWDNSVETHSYKNLNPHWVRPCVYARRRLVELGIIERYKGQYVTPEYKNKLQAKESINTLKKGHHFENGKRVVLELKKVDSFGFEGMYGTTFIITYASKCGKLFKYMGSNPADISTDDFETVKATIKHDNYNGIDETKLQRISLKL